MPLYFAYGTNMDPAGMVRRCRQAKPLGLARLPGHRLALMPEGYLTVERDPTGEVHGVLWSLGLADVRPLDAYEEVGSGLYAKIYTPVMKAEGGSVGALVYIGRRGGAGPRGVGPDHLEGVIAAAIHWGLPDKHVASLSALAQAGGGVRRVVRPAGPLPPGPVEHGPDGRPKVRPRFSTPFDR